MIPEKAEIGIVRCHNGSRVEYPLTAVTRKSRRSLVDTVEKLDVSDDAGCIGCGLQEAVKVTRSHIDVFETANTTKLFFICVPACALVCAWKWQRSRETRKGKQTVYQLFTNDSLANTLWKRVILMAQFNTRKRYSVR